MQRQDTLQSNRSRVQETRRFLAARLLQYSLPLLALFVVLVLGFLVASVVIYVQGWLVMSNSSDKPCDQPLKWWLLAVLWVPIIQSLLTSQSSPEQRPRKCQALLTPVAMLAGAWMVCRCQTCKETAPELYGYTKLYLIFQSMVWVVSFVMSCGVVSLVLWMHRNGYLDTGPGPSMAARAGLINDVDTVTFDPDSFSDRCDDTMQVPECSVCVEEFRDGQEIKRTPCGHYFCEECLSTWLSHYGKSCPLCRTDLEQALDSCDAAAQP